jgi:hypothetical protein
MGLWLQVLPEIVSVEDFGEGFGAGFGAGLRLEENEQLRMNFFLGHSFAE